MAFNLKKFNTEADYSAATLSYPAVSWVTGTDTVHFDKTEPTPPTPTFSGLTVYYNITDTSQPTVLFNGGGGSGSGSGSGSGGALPSAMLIDGTAVEVTNTYQFSTTGEHIVQYSFDANEIPQKFLFMFNYVTKVEIGDAITSIGKQAFADCHNITTVTIGSGVTNISEYAFQEISSATSITSYATTAPTIDSKTFYGINREGTLYVPIGSSGYDVWMGTGDYYLGKYNWTKVEQ